MALLQIGRQPGGHRVVGAQNHQAVEGNLVGEIDEGIAQSCLGPIVVHVLAIDVGDDRDHGNEVAKRAVRLVRLGHQHLALAQARIGPEYLGLAANDRGRVEAGLGENRGDHGGGAGLAV